MLHMKLNDSMYSSTIKFGNVFKVEKAKDFSDSSKPRAWSKYSSDSSAFQKKQKSLEDQQNENTKVSSD